MGLEENKRLARRYLEAWTNQDLELFEEILAPDFVDCMMGRLRTREQLLQEAGTLSAADVRQTIDVLIAEGDKVALRYTSHSSHQPSGKELEFTGMFILEFAHGKIKGGWGERDQLGILRQLGFEIRPPSA